MKKKKKKKMDMECICLFIVSFYLLLLLLLVVVVVVYSFFIIQCNVFVGLYIGCVTHSECPNNEYCSISTGSCRGCGDASTIVGSCDAIRGDCCGEEYQMKCVSALVDCSTTIKLWALRVIESTSLQCVGNICEAPLTNCSGRVAWIDSPMAELYDNQGTVVMASTRSQMLECQVLSWTGAPAPEWVVMGLQATWRRRLESEVLDSVLNPTLVVIDAFDASTVTEAEQRVSRNLVGEGTESGSWSELWLNDVYGAEPKLGGEPSQLDQWGLGFSTSSSDLRLRLAVDYDTYENINSGVEVDHLHVTVAVGTSAYVSSLSPPFAASNDVLNISVPGLLPGLLVVCGFFEDTTGLTRSQTRFYSQGHPERDYALCPVPVHDRVSRRSFFVEIAVRTTDGSGDGSFTVNERPFTFTDCINGVWQGVADGQCVCAPGWEGSFCDNMIPGYCTLTGTPANAYSTDCTALSVGQNCDVQCLSGYEADTPTFFTCAAGGSAAGTGAWSPKSPSCRPIEGYCILQDLPLSSSGFGTCQNTKIGDTCSVTCENGYIPTVSTCEIGAATVGRFDAYPACVDDNECETNNPCTGDDICQNLPGSNACLTRPTFLPNSLRVPGGAGTNRLELASFIGQTIQFSGSDFIPSLMEIWYGDLNDFAQYKCSLLPNPPQDDPASILTCALSSEFNPNPLRFWIKFADTWLTVVNTPTLSDELQFTITNIPFIDSITGCPQEGCPSQGGTLEINGQNFAPLITISVNGKSCPQGPAIGEEKLTCYLDEGTGVNIRIQVSSNGVLSNVKTISYASPTIQTLSAVGCTQPNVNVIGDTLINCPLGTQPTLTITGENFGGVDDDALTVLIGDEICTQSTVIDPHKVIRCTLPPGAGKNRQVVVRTDGGGSTLPNSTATVSYRPCQPGQYIQDNTCEPCAMGKFSDDVNQGICTNCPAGKQQPNPGQQTCRSCEAGRFSIGDGTPVCTSCPVGTSQPEEGQVLCQPCELGKVATSETSEACIACPPGQFANNASSCVACEPGRVSQNPGSISCTECIRPQVAVGEENTKCRFCETGEYAISNSQCQQCPAGKFSSAGNTLSCTDCPLGRFTSAPGRETCTFCSAGKYADVLGTSCLDCDPGTATKVDGSFACVVSSIFIFILFYFVYLFSLVALHGQ